MTIGTLGCVQYGASVIPGVVGWNFAPGALRAILSGDSAIQTQFLAKLGQKPFGSFTTLAIGTAYTALGLAEVIDTALVLRLKHRASAGIDANGTAITIANGVMALRSIDATHGVFANITYDVLARSTDGAASPFAVAVNAKVTSVVEELFTLGSLTISGTPVPGIQSLSVETGVQLRSFGGDGKVYDTFAARVGWAPTIRATSIATDNITAGNLAGPALSGAGAVAVFQKVTNYGGLTGPGDKTATIVKGSVDVDDIGASPGEESGTTFLVTGANTTEVNILTIT